MKRSARCEESEHSLGHESVPEQALPLCLTEKTHERSPIEAVNHTNVSLTLLRAVARPGAPQSKRLLLPHRAATLWEGAQWAECGTRKAEAAKLQGEGISPKPCPRK
jgi:hypothetical protein